MPRLGNQVWPRVLWVVIKGGRKLQQTGCGLLPHLPCTSSSSTSCRSFAPFISSSQPMASFSPSWSSSGVVSICCRLHTQTGNSNCNGNSNIDYRSSSTDDVPYLKILPGWRLQTWSNHIISYQYTLISIGIGPDRDWRFMIKDTQHVNVLLALPV